MQTDSDINDFIPLTGMGNILFNSHEVIISRPIEGNSQ